MHKVIYARSLKGQTVLVEVIAKMYPCNYTLGEETLPLSQYSSQERKKVREGGLPRTGMQSLFSDSKNDRGKTKISDMILSCLSSSLNFAISKEIYNF